MFPRSFEAQIAQRMVIWSAVLGFLLVLYGLVEVIQTQRIEIAAHRMAQSNSALDVVLSAGPTGQSASSSQSALHDKMN